MLEKQELLELYQKEVTISLKFRSALVVGDVMSRQSASKVYNLIHTLVNSATSETDLEDDIDVTLKIGDLMTIFNMMGDQPERLFAEVNKDLKYSLIESLTETLDVEEGEPYETAAALLGHLQSIQENIEDRVTERALDAKNKLFAV